MKIDIELNFSRHHIEEIYFKNNNDNYFFSEETRNYFYALLVSSIIFLASLFYVYKIEFSPIIIFSTLAFVISLILFLIAFYKKWKWKNKIKRWLDGASKYKKNILTLTDETFTLTQDDVVTIAKWASFKNAFIANDYVALQNENNYLIPRKSVTPEQYNDLKKIITEKLNEKTNVVV